MKIFSFIISLFIILLIKKSCGIRLKKFGVPGAVHNGSSLYLHCDFDLENDSLYSVKWYKNNLEFYRYLIKQNQIKPEHKVFSQLGIFIDLNKSNTTHVFLAKTDLNTEGTFGCEVSTDAPSFKTVKAEKDLRIYVSSNQNLEIIGIKQENYNFGDYINLTCKSEPSKPPTILSWFLNNKQITEDSKLPIKISKLKIELNSSGLTTTSLNIEFYITNRIFYQKNGKIKLTCESILTTVYGIAYEELVIEQQNNNNNQLNTYTALREGELDYNFQGDISPPRQENTPPKITQENGSFLIGSNLNLNCSSLPSFPPVYLQWLINNREAIFGVESFIYPYKENLLYKTKGLIYKKYAVFDNNLKPFSTTLSLKLKIEKDLFQTNDGYLRLRCVATHAKLISTKKSELFLFAKSRQASQLNAYSNESYKADGLFFSLLILQILTRT